MFQRGKPLSPLSNSKHCEALHKTALSCHRVMCSSATQWWEHDTNLDLQFAPQLPFYKRAGSENRPGFTRTNKQQILRTLRLNYS